MILQRSSKIQRKEVKVGDDDFGASVISYLLENIANDDILLEIFVRIPNCRWAILCSSISHRWHSLISHPRFVPRFKSHHHQHRDRYPPPCTILIRKCDKTICILYSEESTFLHGKSTPPKCYLDFLPSPMIVRASCDDLLLVTPSCYLPTVFYVCNPVTKQFYRLPRYRKLYHPSRPHDLCGYALVRMPESEYHFKVVLFHEPPHQVQGPITTSQRLTIYCSKLGKWKKMRFIYPPPRGLIFYPSVDVVMCNGILHCLEFVRSSERVLSYDLWGARRGCSAIDFPDDFWSWFRSPDHRGLVREQIGSVGGELRLIQAVLTKRNFVDLKVWRLLDGSSSFSSWVLVHDKKHLKRPNEDHFGATFVHPTDGDMVFVVWGKSVFQYNLMMMEEEDTYEMIDELQEPSKLNTGAFITNNQLMIYPMVHPPWPTPLPSTRLPL